MSVLKSHLTLYFIFGILYFIAIVMDWFFYIICNQAIIYRRHFYYIEESKTSVTNYNCAIIALLFISGIINLIEGYSYFIYVLLLNFSAYYLLLYRLITELIRKKHPTIQKENLLYISLTSVFLICALYISSFIVFDKSFELYKVIIVYGLGVASLVFCATLLYLSTSTQKNTYLMLYTLDIIICELFYGI